MLDAETVLRALSAGAVTATTAGEAKSLPVRMLGEKTRAVFHVTALDTASGNETYLLTIETDSVAAFDDAPVEVARVAVTGTGVYDVPLSAKLIRKLDPNAAAIRCKATLGGTTPSLTYGCHLTAET